MREIFKKKDRQIKNTDLGRRRFFNSMLGIGALAVSGKLLSSCSQSPVAPAMPTKKEILADYTYQDTKKINLGRSIDHDDLNLQLEALEVTVENTRYAYLNIANDKEYLVDIPVAKEIPAQIILKDKGEYAFTLEKFVLRDHIKDCYAEIEIYKK